MKAQSKEDKKQTEKFKSFCCTSGFLLSLYVTLYRTNSRGTQTSRTSSSDITVSNILCRPDEVRSPSESTTELRKMANK